MATKVDRESLPHIEARDRAAWRRWLEKNHAKITTGIWLVYYKKGSGTPSVGYDEAVEEALCFGWIDSIVNSLDDERYRQLYTLRKPKSVWSKLNKTRIDRLIAAGQMRPAGLAAIEVAKANGSWSSLDAVEALEMPADFLAALKKNNAANKHFAAFSNTSKKIALYQINSAKTAPTRAKRVAAIVELATKNIRPEQPQIDRNVARRQAKSA